MTATRMLLRSTVLSFSLLLSAIPAQAATSKKPQVSMPSMEFTSQWSGAVRSGTAFRAISATIAIPVPSGACGASAFGAAFIGLGGFPATPFVQEGFSVDGLGNVGVWYELFSASPVHSPVMVALPAAPGDRLHLRIAVVGDTIDLVFVNLSRQSSTVVEVPGAAAYLDSPGGSSHADWILEQPDLTRTMPSVAVSFENPTAETVSGRSVRAADKPKRGLGAPVLLSAGGAKVTLPAPRAVKVKALACGLPPLPLLTE